jgi:hypothetical protein
MKMIALLSLLALGFVLPLSAKPERSRGENKGGAQTGRALGIEAVLIVASNQPGATDSSLAAYEPTLRRVLRYASYKRIGGSTTKITPPGDGSLSLGSGHELSVNVESADSSGVHVRVSWTGNGRRLMNTGLVLRPGVPAALGGPAWGDKGDVCAVLLIAR